MPNIAFFTKAAKPPQAELDRHLVLAAEEGDLKKMKQLIKAGASIDGRNKPSDDTPLIGAAREGHLDAVKFLLEQGADRSLVNSFKRTALLTALCEHAPDPVILSLVTEGGTLSMTDMHGNPAAYYAAQYGHPEVLEKLAAEGADMAQPGKGGTTPLMRAIELDQREAGRRLIGEKLAPFIGLDSQNDAGETALALAIENKRSIFAMSFIALGANADLKDKQGRTPYTIAEATGQDDILKALEEQRGRKYAASTAAPVRTMKPISLKTGGAA